MSRDDKILDFYEPLAEHYHLIFESWPGSIKRQADILGPLLAAHTSSRPLRILDCACGIGTQAIGFATMGHRVIASDLSPAEVKRARVEARRRGLNLPCYISDMTSLREIREGDFDVVAAFDNALPHLTREQLSRAADAIASKLQRNGLFLASIRDYDQLILERPSVQQPSFYNDAGERRIVHQIWDWIDDDRYTLHLYITTQSDQGWQTRHFASQYRCLLRQELTEVLSQAGFVDIRWLMPNESGFYQPIVLARTSA